MGLKDRITTAIRDQESPWHLGKYQVVVLAALVFFSLLFGCGIFYFGGPFSHTLRIQCMKHVALDVAVDDSYPPLRLMITDPLCTEAIEPDAVLLKSEKLHSVKDRRIRPGVYTVLIRCRGYHEKEMCITVREDGSVAEEITLYPKIRRVRFLVADGLEDYWNKRLGHLPLIAVDEIALRAESGPIVFQGSLLPGHYELEVRRDGYAPHRDQITIVPGTELDYPVPLVPLARKVVIDPQYTISPSDPCPDRSYLQPLSGDDDPIHLVQDGKIVPRQVPPGRYVLFAEKENFRPCRRELFVEPGNRLVYPIDLIPTHNRLLFQVTCDYDVDPVVDPDELTIEEMSVAHRGLKKWTGQPGLTLPSTKKSTLRIDMETLPRRVISEITTEDFPHVVPDVMALTKMVESELQGQKIPLIDGDKYLDVSVKPGRYLLEIEKKGYVKICEPFLIEPANGPMYIERKLYFWRPLIPNCYLDSDYRPGFSVTPDKVIARKAGEDRVILETGNPLRPGYYTVCFSRAGFHDLVREISITPGGKEYYFKGQFQAKMRKLAYDIRDKNGVALEPELVEVDGRPLRAGDEVRPGPRCAVTIYKHGYATWKDTVDICPAEEPFCLSATLKILRR